MVLVATMALGGCASGGDDPTVATADSKPPSDSSTSSTSSAGAATPQGFDAVAAVVTRSDGTTCAVCLWLAATPDQRRRGLMSVTDLGDADGMAFGYDRPTTTRFWMRDTLLPLSIAFYDAAGGYLDAFDMEPCTTADCLLYPTAPDFVVAVETVAGGLPALGMTSGSTLALSERPCDPAS